MAASLYKLMATSLYVFIKQVDGSKFLSVQPVLEQRSCNKSVAVVSLVTRWWRICKPVVTWLLNCRYQDAFVLCLFHAVVLWQVWNKLLSPCYKVDDGNRFATSCSKSTDTGCHGLVMSAFWQERNDLVKFIAPTGACLREANWLPNLIDFHHQFWWEFLLRAW